MSDFKFNSAAVRRLSDVEVTAASRQQNPAHEIATPGTSEFAREMSPYDRLETIYLLIQPTIHVFFCLRRDGSKYWRRDDGIALSFEQAEQIIADRVPELGLSRELLDAWCGSTHSIAKEQQYQQLPFEERLKRFKEATEGAQR